MGGGSHKGCSVTPHPSLQGPPGGNLPTIPLSFFPSLFKFFDEQGLERTEGTRLFLTDAQIYLQASTIFPHPIHFNQYSEFQSQNPLKCLPMHQSNRWARVILSLWQEDEKGRKDDKADKGQGRHERILSSRTGVVWC